MGEMAGVEDATNGHADGRQADAAATQPELGRALRRLRRERGKSLTAVSEATGVSASFLSVVENGRSDITIGRLMRLLAHYEAGIGDLLDGEQARERIVTAAGEQLRLQSPAEGVDLYLLAPDTRRTMMPVLGVHEPGSRLTDLKPHGGETFVFMLEGTLLFERDGHPPFVLSAGDSAYFTGDAPPTVTTVGDTQARLIAVVSPPTL
jgi:transcriptional regulator with XRE-family HTH domain